MPTKTTSTGSKNEQRTPVISRGASSTCNNGIATTVLQEIIKSLSLKDLCTARIFVQIQGIHAGA